MRYLLFFVLVVLSFGVFTLPALAAVIKIDSDFESVNVGDVFTVSVSINTESQTLNAVETEVVFPSEILEFVANDDSESVVSLWVQRPAYDGRSIISLSGVTPGGFSSINTNLITLEFKAIKEGQGNIETNNTKLLLHDGLGTEASIVKHNLPITINNGESEVVVNTVDDERPENFIPEIINDTDVFGGKSTLIFATKDKGSGIDRYEVKEGRFGRYHEAESPYELKNQNLDKKIQVRAIDNAGNERVETIYPQNWRPINEHLWLIVSILILCVLSLLVGRRFFKARVVK